MITVGEFTAWDSRRLADMLSPDDASVVRLLGQSSQSGEGDALAEGLGASLGLPGVALHRQLLRTSKAMDELIRAIEHDTVNPTPRATFEKRSASFAPELVESSPRLYGGGGARRRKRAPALLRPITVPDDPQFGRFGGKAHNRGFNLDAYFENLRAETSVKINLQVRGEASDGTPVQFFLHDSFQPQMHEVLFKAGVAEFGVAAWRGFTVGAWLPFEGIELELDLAAMPDAPQVIRDR